MKKTIGYAAGLALLLFACYTIDFQPLELLAGIPEFLRFLFLDFLPPSLADLSSFIAPVIDTLFYAVVATVISSFFGALLAFLIASDTAPFKGLRILLKIFCSLLRNIPILVWASLLVLMFGIGKIPGVLALIIFGTGFLARSYAEAIEEMDKQGLEALQACGASFPQQLFRGYLPMFLPYFYTWTLFMFEIDIKASTILGIVGAGGIGISLKEALALFHYHKAATIIMIMITMILLVEWGSQQLKRRLV